jgi:Flp pilus assembly protein TadD
MGMVFLKQQKIIPAEAHLRQAIQINQSNSVLHSTLGMILSMKQQYDDALNSFKLASLIDPKNTVAKFKRAIVLSQLGKLEVIDK